MSSVYPDLTVGSAKPRPLPMWHFQQHKELVPQHQPRLSPTQPHSLVASWLQAVALLGHGLSVMGLSPCSHGCKPLPGAAVKPLGKQESCCLPQAHSSGLAAPRSLYSHGDGLEMVDEGLHCECCHHGPRNGNNLVFGHG